MKAEFFVAKDEMLVTLATVLVTILSPNGRKCLCCAFKIAAMHVSLKVGVNRKLHNLRDIVVVESA